MLELIAYIVFVLLLALYIFISIRLHFAFGHFKIDDFVSEPSMLSDMPSVSVCIPARNETHVMTECLERVLASTYPKLEIIVLDDSSVDDTSILIKSFAHAGVRFVEGSPLPEGWLGKNNALEGLLNEASGTYIVYMDVDTHIKPDTIEQLVSYAKTKNASMVSILPRREDGWRASIIFSTLRYYWELLLHRRQAPAVASSLWLINRQVLRDDLGGFTPIKSAIQPEARLAALLMARNTYRFLISTRMLGVSYEKKWRSQIETSSRLLFPIFGGRVISSIIVILLLIIAAMPPFIVLIGLAFGWNVIHTLSLIMTLFSNVLYGLYLRHIWNHAWWLGGALWPIILIQEIVVFIMSIVKYKTHVVTWKGRPIISPSRTR